MEGFFKDDPLHDAWMNLMEMLMAMSIVQVRAFPAYAGRLGTLVLSVVNNNYEKISNQMPLEISTKLYCIIATALKSCILAEDG